MSEQRINIYEGLFLFPHSASANLQAAADHVKEILQRADAEIISFRKWDERRLAYEIKGNKRGVYFLAYFKADPSKLVGLERDCNLSEQLLRSLVTRAEHIPAETVEAAEGRAKLADEIKIRAQQAESAAAAKAEVAVATQPEEAREAEAVEETAEPVAASEDD